MGTTLTLQETLAPKILIADDDPAIVRLLSDYCGKMGFKIETAANGVQLLIKARRSRPDVMIVDVNLPDVDGITVCTRLFSLNGRRIEAVVVSGYSDPATVERCNSLGVRFGRKGPDFWKFIKFTLGEIYPDLAPMIASVDIGAAAPNVPLHPRVLVVDDDPAIEHFIAGKLAACGIDTLYANNAADAYRLACKARPSVIVTDYAMPDGDALYLLFRLRRTATAASVPVIVITGHTLGERTEQTLREPICGRPGAAQVLRKSPDTRELFGAIQKFCKFGSDQVTA